MGAYEFPADLVDLWRAFWESHRIAAETADSLPSSVAVLAGEAEITDEQRQRVKETQAARHDALAAFNGHPYWDGVDNIHAAKLELRELCPPMSQVPR